MNSPPTFLTIPAELRIKMLGLSLAPALVQVLDHPVSQSTHRRRRRLMKDRCQDTDIEILKAWSGLAHKRCGNLKYFDCSGRSASNHLKPISPEMSLLLSCRQVHQEVVEIVYDKSIFSFDSVRVFRDFVNLHNSASQRIRTLVMDCVLEPGSPQYRTYQSRHQSRPTMLANPMLSTFLELVFLDMPLLRSIRLSLDSYGLLQDDLVCSQMTLVQVQTIDRFSEIGWMIVRLATRRRKGTAVPLKDWEMCVLPDWEMAQLARGAKVRAEVKGLIEWAREEVCRAA